MAAFGGADAGLECRECRGKRTFVRDTGLCMDFTGILALFISGIVGFTLALIFAIKSGRNYPMLILSILALAIILDFALLVDWTRTSEFTFQFLLSDATMFLIVGLIGGGVGAAPVLICYWIYQAAKRRDAL